MNFYTFAKHYGNKILVRGIRDDERYIERHDFKPSFFVRSDKSTQYKGIRGENLEELQFECNKEATAFREKYKEVSNFDIYGQEHYGYQYITQNYPGEMDFDLSKVKIFSIDIETTADNGFPQVANPIEQVLLITIQDATTKRITTFGRKPFEPGEHTKDFTVDYFYSENETDLLRSFLGWWESNYPDVLTGWNSELFDLPYLVARVDRILPDAEDERRRFSPFGLVHKKQFMVMGREQIKYEITGLAQLDYLDLYRKFTYTNQESYKLDHIAFVELGKRKLESGYDTFREHYENDWNGFVEYNIIDTVLVDQLEAKMKLIELIMTMAYDAKCNYGDIFSSVRTWDCLLYNHLWDKGIILPPKKMRPARTIEGAYVQEPKPGAYEWVASFDATSLYPSIIMQYNMSPETMTGEVHDVTVDGLLEKQYDIKLTESMAANGYCFHNDHQGLFPEIVQKFFRDRQRYKKLMLDAQSSYEKTKDKQYLQKVSQYNNFQMARKIQLNSLYGAMANEYFRFYDDRIAEGITMTGQYIIRATAKALDNYLNEVCGTENEMYSFYSDTDSCYITLDNLVQKFFADKDKEKIVDVLDKIGTDKIEPCISKAMDEIVEYTNAFEKHLVFKREAIADKSIWVAKKRYAMNVYDNEGVRYAEPKLKVMGLEIVRSSTPAPVRESLKEAVNLCLTGSESELQNYIKEQKDAFKKMPVEEISFPRGCNNLEKYKDAVSIYTKGTPMHVRGCLLYNYTLAKKNLANKYEEIMEGDKIKFVYLKVPNLLGENVIAFNGKLPKEFDLHQYVDYDTMFDKAFVEPMNTIVKTIGWTTEKVNTLDGLFA